MTLFGPAVVYGTLEERSSGIISLVRGGGMIKAARLRKHIVVRKG